VIAAKTVERLAGHLDQSTDFAKLRFTFKIAVAGINKVSKTNDAINFLERTQRLLDFAHGQTRSARFIADFHRRIVRIREDSDFHPQQLLIEFDTTSISHRRKKTSRVAHSFNMTTFQYFQFPIDRGT
jgi:hypothetical protein